MTRLVLIRAGHYDYECQRRYGRFAVFAIHDTLFSARRKLWEARRNLESLYLIGWRTHRGGGRSAAASDFHETRSTLLAQCAEATREALTVAENGRRFVHTRRVLNRTVLLSLLANLVVLLLFSPLPPA
ncbi:hypothetical protein [Thermobifida halotolerans]|uniref:hypothetical protein n=1 Tax=Thermobifida halotolerans TaxID=483545 RepID=UPI0011C390ED|nr:hypothetical protein [Thermobifida halotolerans]